MSESPHFPKCYPVPTIRARSVHGEKTVILDPASSGGQGPEPQGPQDPKSMWREKSDEGRDHQTRNEGDQRAPKPPTETSGFDPGGGGHRIEAEEGDASGNRGPERSTVMLPFGHALCALF